MSCHGHLPSQYSYASLDLPPVPSQAAMRFTEWLVTMSLVPQVYMGGVDRDSCSPPLIEPLNACQCYIV